MSTKTKTPERAFTLTGVRPGTREQTWLCRCGAVIEVEQPEGPYEFLLGKPPAELLERQAQAARESRTFEVSPDKWPGRRNAGVPPGRWIEAVLGAHPECGQVEL